MTTKLINGETCLTGDIAESSRLEAS